MLVSLEWLNEYIDLRDISVEQIAHELTMSGLEVEDIEKIEAKFTNIVTAQILEIKKHPEADKLHLVTVFNGTEKREVVCGAQNLIEGAIIPYASVGSKVLDRKTGEQFELKPVKIRGIESQGMLCSDDELGVAEQNLQEEDGILILSRIFSDVKPGQDVKDVLGIKPDVVFNVAPTANRGDQMSVLGVARELSSIFNKKLTFSKIETDKDLSNPEFEVEIKDEDTCKYYALATLKNLTTKPSPEWMKRRLIASGIRAINNIVDITNYVMLEYGQPLHAFDLSKLDGYLCVRRAQEGEKITTLDEVERKLTKDSVLIADRTKGVALAGVMGGNNSEIDDNTVNIALESAYFTPATNRRSSRSVGHRTDACARFERGVDIENVKPALMRAIGLLIELADAEVVGIAEVGNGKLPDMPITLRFSEIKRILGIEIPQEKCIEILGNLGFELQGKNELAARFLTPSYRQQDVTREIDLIEEIARIYGYDKIEATLPAKTFAPTISQESKNLNQINKLLLAQGLNEIVTSSLFGEPLLNWAGISYDKENAVKVANPQSEDHTMLRQSLVPSMLQVVKNNFDNGQKNIMMYEVGKTYLRVAEPNEKSAGVEERRIIQIGISGNLDNAKWTGSKTFDFYAIKGILENLFQEVKVSGRIQYKVAEGASYLHPGKAAQAVVLGKQPTVLATFGELHPNLKNKFKLNQDLYLAEVDLDLLLSIISDSTVKFKELPQFPAVYRDMAFVIPDEVAHQEIAKIIKKASGKLFKECEIFDIYKGEHVKDGYKSVAYRVHLQDESATLTDEIVDKEISAIKSGLKKAYAELEFRE
jgi:phenylalanyl-tRNA synthetase beta chain